MKSHPGIAATMFETLAGEEINIDMISTSTIRTSCMVRTADVERAVRCLHAAFHWGDATTGPHPMAPPACQGGRRPARGR